MSKELIFIRHAPISTPGRLCGRTDVPAQVVDADIAAVQTHLPTEYDIIISPAVRCRQTAQAIFPAQSDFVSSERLWEQDFGDHDGLEFGDIPDIGRLSSVDLAQYRPPNGESFADLYDRVCPVLDGISGGSQDRAVIIVAHAGVVRAALGWVLGAVHLGLAFEIAPLSITRIRVDQEGPVSIIETNFRAGHPPEMLTNEQI